MNKPIYTLLLLTLLVLPLKAESPILKISVLSSGNLLLNGKPSKLEIIESKFKKHKNASVWYYRENSSQEPPPISAQVIKLVIDNKLSISLSTKPDFSDYVNENGISQPRKP
jgi:hypothetical protein